MIPENEEHWEAGQAEIDRAREIAFAAMPAEEQHKMREIERAVSILENAKVPFFLWSSPENDVKGLWQYHRSTYQDQFSEGGEEDRRKLMSLGIYAASHFFARTWHFDIVATDEWGKKVMECKFRDAP